jgi:site-specific DNA-methyltransferase (adenine-specific)
MSAYTLHLGDCLDVMRTMDAQSVDAICTDLPYQMTKCAWDTVIPFAPMWEQVKRLLKPRGVFVTTASQPFTSALVMSNAEWFRYAWVWTKNLKVGHLNARIRPMVGHEDIVVFASESPNYNFQQRRRMGQAKAGNKRNGTTTVYGSMRDFVLDRQGEWIMPDTVLQFDCVHSSDGRDHPTQKPVALYAYLIRTYTNAGDTVLDFCMGSGTTGVACIKTGRNFIGVELDSGYFAIAQRRIEDAAAQPSLFEIGQLA